MLRRAVFIASLAPPLPQRLQARLDPDRYDSVVAAARTTTAISLGLDCWLL